MRQRETNAYIAVISHQRPQNVPKLSALIGNATWYVGKGEKQIYQNHGAERVVEGGGLCESRNMALRDSWALGLPCVQLSDDLRQLKIARVQKESAREVSVNASFVEVVNHMLNRMKEADVRLAGIAPTANIFYFNPEKCVSKNLFIVGDFIIVDECDLFFDEKLRLKEDYDYTLQHLTKYGAVARCNDVLAHFLHRTNAGGACAVRTSALEKEMILYLKLKWGTDKIRDNGRRPDEILLRWKPELA